MSGVSKGQLILLNSRLLESIFKHISQFLSGGFRHTKQYIEKLPIRLPEKGQERYFEMLADYLLFLNAKEEWREGLKEMIEFFDRGVADSLVYELYFKEKFHEDGLYPEERSYLLEAVSKHLKTIEYDRWAELYWKKQIEGELSEEEERELQELEEKNLKTIEEVYRELSEDEEVKKWVEKIKSHPWVRVIEGGGEDA